MRYRIRQKLLSLGNDFAVTDEHGAVVLRFDGHAFSFADKLTLLDADGATIGLLRKRLVSLRQVYDLYKGDTLFASISKDLFTVFREGFTVDVPGPNDYSVRGSFFDHEYTFWRGGAQVAQVSKAWFSLTDSYGVEVVDGEDVVTILATAVVIDQLLHEGRDEDQGA